MPVFFREGEKDILLLMSRYPEMIDEAKESIPAEAMFIENHRLIYGLMLSRREQGLDCSFISLTQALRDTGRLAQFDNGAELTFLADPAYRSSWDSSKRQVLARYHARNVINAAMEMSEAAQTSPETLQDTVDRLLPLLQGGGKQGSDMKSLRELLFEAQDRWEGQRSRGISFGFDKLDDATGGAFPGEMTIVCGQAKSGKTSLAMQMGASMAVEGHPVAVFSLEMSDAELVDRLTANEAMVDLKEFRHGKYSTQGYSRISGAISRMCHWPIWISQGAVSLGDIVSSSRNLKAKNGLALVIVDYIQLVETSRSKNETREQQVAFISRSLKRLATELGIHVIALSQLNEDGKLRESRAIGQDANLVLVVDPGKEACVRVLRIAMQRNGPAGGEIPLTFRGEHLRFMP